MARKRKSFESQFLLKNQRFSTSYQRSMEELIENVAPVSPEFSNECFPFHTFRYYNRERNSIEQASPVTERNALARRNRRI